MNMLKNLWKKICAWERCARKNSRFTFAVWMAIGISIGLTIFDNVAIGAGLGAALGLAMSAETNKKGKNKEK